METHMKSITKAQFDRLVELVCLKPSDKINFSLFIGCAALSERILYDHFV
jgi:hypothetical protein